MTGKAKGRIQTPEEWYRCRQPEIIQMLQEYQCVPYTRLINQGLAPSLRVRDRLSNVVLRVVLSQVRILPRSQPRDGQGHAQREHGEHRGDGGRQDGQVQRDVGVAVGRLELEARPGRHQHRRHDQSAVPPGRHRHRRLRLHTRRLRQQC